VERRIVLVAKNGNSKIVRDAFFCGLRPNKSLDASGGGVFRIKLRPAMLE
jgi:hypothetical protein